MRLVKISNITLHWYSSVVVFLFLILVSILCSALNPKYFILVTAIPLEFVITYTHYKEILLQDGHVAEHSITITMLDQNPACVPTVVDHLLSVMSACVSICSGEQL
jgi:hypothetical protein